MAKILSPLFPIGRKAVVCDANTEHGFTLNEIVSYIGSVKRNSGSIWHSFENEDGRIDTLIDGEFELLPEKKTYGVRVIGCDDVTVFNKEMTDEEFKFLSQFAEETKKASAYSCQPTIEIGDEIELYEAENE